MRKISSIVLFLVVVSAGGLLPACNTDYHFSYTPHLDRDFDRPEAEVEYDWYDIDRYKEKTFPFTAFFEMPALSELKYANFFLEPVERRFSWWNLCPFFAIPPLCPCERMKWERGNFRFNAVVTYPLLFGFRPHVWYWEVEEIQPGMNG